MGYTNIELIFELDQPIPYPNENERKSKYTEPMTREMEPLFDGGINVLWFENAGKLDSFSIACFGPNKYVLKYFENMEEDPRNDIVDGIIDRVADFWEQKGTTLKLKRVSNLAEKDLFEFTANVTTNRRLPYKHSWTWS